MVANDCPDMLAARAYTIASLAGGGGGIDRYVLEGLLGHGSGPLIDWMISRRHLVEVENGGRLVAAKPPRLVPDGRPGGAHVAGGA